MSVVILSCQSSVKSMDIEGPLLLQASSLQNSNSEYFYTTKSDVVVMDLGKKTRSYVDFAEFRIQRHTLHLGENGEMQFRVNTSHKKGNMSLNDMGYPEPNETLLEVIDSYGKPVVVKDYPIGSVFYLPRVSLPENPVNEGDKWSYRGRWISRDTGWPFEIEINSKLTSWADCQGTLCAVIDFTARVILPEDFPLRSTIKSNIKGRLHYSPHSFDVLWGESESDEMFEIAELKKQIIVKTKSCSYKIGYNKNCPKL